MYNYYKLCKPYLSSKSRMLDIGCDVGYFLETGYKDRFIELHGSEPTPHAIEIAKQLPSSCIEKKFYEELSYDENYFDLISLVHLLEYLVDSQKVLITAKKELTSKGVVMGIVHNSRSILVVLMGSKFPVYNLYHYYYFNKNTLRKLFESQGYHVIKVVSTSNCYSLGFFIQKIPFLPTSITNIILKILKKFKMEKITLNLAVGNI